ncbi:MAG: ribonuclease Y [Patescibacteria group bacterium]
MDLKLFAFFATIIFVSLLGVVVGYLWHYVRNTRAQGKLEERLSRMRVEVQDEIAQLKERANKDVAHLQEEVRKRQEKIDIRESKLDARNERLDDVEAKLQSAREEITQEELKLKTAQEALEAERIRLAHTDPKTIREELYREIEEAESEHLSERMDRLDEEGDELYEEKAKDILASAIQRYGNSIENDMISTHLAVDDEEKGKIIGKEGRNIKALERESGVQLIIDDTPGQITISSFDPIRRVVAKTALEELLADGRVQPARIEEAVKRAQQTIDDSILKEGRKAAKECNVPALPQELLHILGRLYFRYSYGQNVLQHSKEMAHIANVIANEIGADAFVARAGALLHDIGKAVDHEVEGTHVEIGRRILQKYGVDESIIKAMQAHHEEYPYETVESRIVQTADAISSARPGARSENAELFIQKMEDLERIARGAEGVEDAYAIAAGREVRVFVSPEAVSDYQSRKLARAIAAQIKKELRYPGEIKVVVIREQRSIEYAR